MRKRVKSLLSGLEVDHPGVRASLFAAMGNVMPEHLLDARLFAARSRQGDGPDPWIDEGAEDGASCGKEQPRLTRLAAPRAAD
jgi:hypothetical protein